MADHELIEESRHHEEYRRAVSLLASVAGPSAAEKVDPGRSSLSRGMWAMASRSGRLLAEVNIHAGTVLIHALPTLSAMRVARVLTTRVVCECGQPKVLQGAPRSGDSYECPGCATQVFIAGR
jgi:hypothetical protein